MSDANAVGETLITKHLINLLKSLNVFPLSSHGDVHLNCFQSKNGVLILNLFVKFFFFSECNMKNVVKEN